MELFLRKFNLAIQVPVQFEPSKLVLDPDMRLKIKKDQLIGKKTTPRMIFEIAFAKKRLHPAAKSAWGSLLGTGVGMVVRVFVSLAMVATC